MTEDNEMTSLQGWKKLLKFYIQGNFFGKMK